MPEDSLFQVIMGLRYRHRLERHFEIDTIIRTGKDAQTVRADVLALQRQGFLGGKHAVIFHIMALTEEQTAQHRAGQRIPRLVNVPLPRIPPSPGRIGSRVVARQPRNLSAYTAERDRRTPVPQNIGGYIIERVNAWYVRVRWDDGRERLARIGQLKLETLRDLAARERALRQQPA
jgi:hypothetical protein